MAEARVGYPALHPRSGRWTIRGKGGKVRGVALNASTRAALARYLATAAAVLGHSSVATLARHYRQPGASAGARALDRLSED